ncbi:MAG TPA: flippase [Sphingomicrobium sp.]
MSLSRNAAYNLIGQAAPIVVSLVTIPIYLKLVGVERYGVLAIAWMLLGYFGLFDFGLTRATSYRIAYHRDGTSAARALTFGTAIAVAFGLAVIGAILLYFGGYWYFTGPFEVSPSLRAEAVAALPILAFALPGAIIAGVLNGSLQGRERFFEVNVVGIGTSTLSQIMPVLVAWLIGPRLGWLLAASVGVQFAAIAILWWRCRVRVLEGNRFRASGAEARALLHYGGWITVSTAVAPFMVVVDRFVIGTFFDAKAVTAYTVPAMLAQRVSMIPYSLSAALFPRLSADTDRASAAKLSLDATRAAMTILTPVVMGGICIMGPFLQIWLGGALPREATTIGQVALLGWWVNGLAINPYSLLQATGRPRITALLHLSELPIYALLLWFFTSRYGLVGAAVASSIRCAIDCLILSLLAYRRATGLLPYAVPAVILIAAVPIVGTLQLTVGDISLAAALIGVTLVWSALVLPPELRQSLINMIFRSSNIKVSQA